jgi:transcriptional regulator with XRE-family HTH domain
MATIGQRLIGGGQTRRGARNWVLHKSHATGPQLSRPAITPLPMPYGVHMRNTPGPERGTWATYIKAAREHARLNKTQLAQRIGKDRATVGRWEDGKNRPEDANLVALVAEVLGLDQDEALAAAGLRPGVEAPVEPTREPDEEVDLIMRATVDDATRRQMLERLAELRERDRLRRLEDIRWLIERRA